MPTEVRGEVSPFQVPEKISGFSDKLLEVRRLLVDLNAAIGVLAQQHELEVHRISRTAAHANANVNAKSAEYTSVRSDTRSEDDIAFCRTLSDEHSCVSSGGETAIVGETASIKPPRIVRAFVEPEQTSRKESNARAASKERVASKDRARAAGNRASSEDRNGDAGSRYSSKGSTGSVIIGEQATTDILVDNVETLVSGDVDPQPPKEPPQIDDFPPAPDGGEPAPGRTANPTRSAWRDDMVGKKASITALEEMPLALPNRATDDTDLEIGSGVPKRDSMNGGAGRQKGSLTGSMSCSPANRLIQARLRAKRAENDDLLPGANPEPSVSKEESDDDKEEDQSEELSFIRKTMSDGGGTLSRKLGSSGEPGSPGGRTRRSSNDDDDGDDSDEVEAWQNGPAMDHIFTSPSPAVSGKRLGDGLCSSARSTISKKVSVVGPKEEVAMRIIRQSARSVRSHGESSRGSTGGRSSMDRGNGSLRVPMGGRWSATSEGSTTPVLTLQTWKARASGGGSTIGFDGEKAEKMHFGMHPHTKNLWRRAINRAKFLAKMKINGRNADPGAKHESEGKTLDDDEDPVYFWMSDIWKERRDKSFRRNMTSMSNVLNTVALLPGMGSEDEGGIMKLRLIKWYDRLMINPNAPGRILWDMMGCFLFIYDAVFIPLEFFNLQKILFLVIMSWIIRLYWTFDIPLSFFTAKELSAGTIEKDFWKIAKNYVTTWLPIDIALVIIEWLEIVGESRQEFGIARLGKMARNLRMLRMFRFLKIINTVNLPEELKGLAYIRSEKLMIVFGIIKIMIAIVWVNHFLACFWYGIGNSEREDCWVEKHHFRDEPIGYVYTTSFHWALTQFTGNMEIMAYNHMERAFSIIVLLAAFVISAFAVSSITTSMTRLQIVTAAQSKQFSDLRKYLASNNISKQLAMRINKSANSAVAHQQKNMPEDSVDLLKMVSEPLRIELHYEVNAPCLTCHPFFNSYDAKCRASMRQVCHQSVAKLTLHRGDLVFSSGEMPEEPVMFFIVLGKLLYLHNDTVPVNVQEGQWAAEAVLWTLWVYHGTMRAKGDCNLLILDAQKFQKIACQFLAKDGANPIPYGRDFVKYLNNTKRADLTDLEDPKMELSELVKQVFGNTARRPSFAMGPMFGSQGSDDELEGGRRASTATRASRTSIGY